MAKVRAHVLVSGLVQGVFFRANTCEQAERVSVNGWVRNRADRKVEAVFEGDEENVKELIQWCHQGPPGAHVRNVEVTWEEYLGEYDSFFVK